MRPPGPSTGGRFDSGRRIRTRFASSRPSSTARSTSSFRSLAQAEAAWLRAPPQRRRRAESEINDAETSTPQSAPPRCASRHGAARGEGKQAGLGARCSVGAGPQGARRGGADARLCAGCNPQCRVSRGDGARAQSCDLFTDCHGLAEWRDNAAQPSGTHR